MTIHQGLHRLVVRRFIAELPRIHTVDFVMTHALENYNCTISIVGRQITDLRFADDIDGEEDELTKLVHNLDTAATKFGMETSAEKPKIMTNNGTLQRDITIQGQKLEIVDHFK